MTMTEGPSGGVLVFGASSQIGDPLLPLLSGAGYQVRAISRTPAANRAGVRWEQGDFAQVTSAPAQVVSLGPLIDFAHWFEQTEGIDRVVAVGSVSLRHKRASSAPEERAVAAALQDGEQRLIRHAEKQGTRLTLLRPCLLYGAGRDHTVAPAMRFARDRGWLPLPMPAAGLRQPLHVADLAIAIKQCLGGAAVGQTLELGGAEKLSFEQLLRRIADCVPHCRIRRLPIQPLSWASALASPFSLRARRLHRALARAHVDQLADDSCARQSLDWHPRPFVPAAAD